MITGRLFGDAFTLMLVANVLMLSPLIYKKKQAQVDKISTIIDEKLDKIIKMVPFFGKNKISEGKKQL